MSRRVLGALFALLLLAFTVTLVTMATTEPSPAATFRPPALAAPNTLVRGVVTREGVPADAKVTAVLWPDGEKLAALPLGSPVDTFELPSVTTDENGYFTIRLDPATVPPDHTGDNRIVDVELRVVARGNLTPWSFSVTRTKQLTSQGRRMAWSTFDSDKPAMLRIDLKPAPTPPSVTGPGAG